LSLEEEAEESGANNLSNAVEGKIKEGWWCTKGQLQNNTCTICCVFVEYP